MSIKEIDENNFEEEVLKSKVPVVIDMWAAWCGPCRMYSPVIEEVSNEYGNKAKFVKIDVDNNQKLAERYGVMSIPTTLLITGGTVKAENIGAISKEALKRWLDQNIRNR